MSDTTTSTPRGGRALALLVGLVLTLGIAEAGLRVAGLFFDRSSPMGDGELVVQCEGDSFTYGIGGLSFPQQLVEIVEDRYGAGSIRAINEGIPGANTALIADEVAERLKTHQPDVLVVLAGENNSWNAIRSSVGDLKPSFWTSADRLLLHSRVYKFLKVAAIGWNHATFHQAAGPADSVESFALHLVDSDEGIGLVFDDHLQRSPRPAIDGWTDEDSKTYWHIIEEGDYLGCLTKMRGLIEQDPTFLPFHNDLASCHLRLGQLDEAIDILEAATDLPNVKEHHETYHMLGHAYERREERAPALDAWRRGLSVLPESLRLYQALARVKSDDGDFWGAVEFCRDIPGIDANQLFTYHARLLEKYPNHDIDELVVANRQADMVRIAETAARMGIPTIFLSYPYNHYPDIAQAAEQTGSRYIDLRTDFDTRFERREDYISADNCHCNTAGYRLIAEVLAAEIEDMFTLTPPAP